MDLSSLSTEDLQALKAGDLSKVSTEGLTALKGSTTAAAPVSHWDEFVAGLKASPVTQAGLGAIRGAAGIGATIMQPFQALEDKLTGKTAPTLSSLVTGQKPMSSNQETRAGLEGGMAALGGNPRALPFQAGKLGAEIAGTAGVGGALAAPLRLAGPAVAPLAEAVASSGFTTGRAVAPNALARVADMGTRMAGGAATGAASAGLIDPDSMKTGAAIGAALPPAMKIAGLVAEPVGNALSKAARTVTQPRDVAGAEDIAKALEASTPDQLRALVDKLRSGETLVTPPTAAQALQTPEASILQRVVHDSPGASALRNKIAQQAEARLNALERVAPTNAAGLAQAREDLGQSVSRYVVPEERRLSKQAGEMFENIDPNAESRIGLPLEQMRGQQDRYLGAGSFGQGKSAQQALDAAHQIGVETVEGQEAKRLVPWSELQNLRVSIGDAWKAATAKEGMSKEAAALNAMKRDLDNTIEQAAIGEGKHGDYMPPDVVAKWREANASYAALQDRFHTGPQAGIFRNGGDGQPSKQGGEIASAFWGNRPGLADDVQSFKRLVDESPSLLGQFKSLVTTHGASTADAAGNLTTKFSKWVSQTLPGLREAFSPDEVKTLQRIAADIDRAATANKLGTSLGGSNTYQNAANALDLGLLDSPALTKAASMVPGVKYATAPALEGVRNMARNAKATRMAELLADSDLSANAIEKLLRAKQQPPSANALSRLVVPSIYRGGPRTNLDGNR